MIVYRKSEYDTVTLSFAKELLTLAESVQSVKTHELAAELLIEFGRFESGVADSLFPEKDGVNEISAALRRASIAAGHVFRASWEEKPEEVSVWAGRLKASLARIRQMLLPARIKTRIPEGYAHYGLFPEVYLAAARKFHEERKPADVVCIGLRSIGASLSSVIAAELESLGSTVLSFTLRPRGHPFKRKAVLTAELEEIAAGLRTSVFVIADEGPGLSGSSFSSVAEKLSRLGIPDENIVLFPSWDPDGADFVSKEARRRWGLHARYVSYFEDVWLPSGRLQREAGLDAPLQDISAGMWRRLFWSEHDYPAAHPRHERRKYLSGDPSRGGAYMLKFAGLGRYGASKMERSAMLSEAGLTEPVERFTNGFIVTRFAYGRPVAEREMNQLLLDEMARYSSFLKRNFRSSRKMSFEEFLGMISRNITLGLGTDWGDKAGALERLEGVFESSEAVHTDGRMFPFEWILTKKGYRKTDCLDHHLDQFFPSSQDIAWDLAMATVEFEMNPMEQNYFISRYSAASGDGVSQERLRLYSIAFLAFRLGYTAFASEELAKSPEGPRFSSLVHRYSSRLKRELLWLAD